MHAQLHGRCQTQVCVFSGKPAAWGVVLGVTVDKISQSRCNKARLYLTKVLCQIFGNDVSDRWDISGVLDRILILAPQAHPGSRLGGADEFDAQTFKCPANLIQRS